MQSLRHHIDRLGITDSAFAARLGVSKSYLSQILSGARTPSRDLIQKISDTTAGDVPPSAWFKTTGGDVA